VGRDASRRLCVTLKVACFLVANLIAAVLIALFVGTLLQLLFPRNSGTFTRNTRGRLTMNLNAESQSTSVSLSKLRADLLPNGHNPHIRFQLFSGQTILVGPVFLLPPKGMVTSNPFLTMKLLFSDGENLVIACPMRELWAGSDGVAYDAKPGRDWQIVARNTKSGLTLL
jgi:hypothetical protein